jgi:hypothetical protein
MEHIFTFAGKFSRNRVHSLCFVKLFRRANFLLLVLRRRFDSLLLCRLKGMMPGIQDMLKDVATKKGLDYEEWLKDLKAKKQWHVEVY